MKPYAIILLVPVITCCTLSVIQTDTHGTATDVVDSTPSTTADVKPDVDLSIPMAPMAPL